MKHTKIEASRFLVSAPSVVVHAVLLRQLPILMTTLSHIRLCFSDPGPDHRDPETAIRIGFEEPSAPNLTHEYAGTLTFSAYVPRTAVAVTGWVAGGGEQNGAISSELEKSVFGMEPAIRMSSLSTAQATMKTMRLAGVLPDIIGRKDPALRRLDETSGFVQRPLWLSYAPSADNREDRATVLSWIRACISESAWLNASGVFTRPN
ncbi:MAG: hypothetical protein HKP40_09230 [Litoreibacter sp.]|nr:hypothetical protein [Litoreibacter sp.]